LAKFIEKKTQTFGQVY